MSIKEMGGKICLEKFETGELSIINELGASDLFKETPLIGNLVKLLCAVICSEKDDAKLREKACRILRFFAPVKLLKTLPACSSSVVIGFNHPSLGEIIRLACLVFEAYPTKELLFPVSLAWYEAMRESAPSLARLKLKITPILTPSVEAKLNKKFTDDEEQLGDIQFVKSLLERNYLRTVKAAAENGDCILVAPSATRQAAVIGETVLPVMTLLAKTLYRKSDLDTVFAPVAVIPPVRSNRMLNLFKSYTIAPCEIFTADEVKELTSHGREFDFIFLKRIESSVNAERS